MKNIPHKKQRIGIVDPYTFLIFILQSAGGLACFLLVASNRISWPLGIVAGSLLMNLSFTVWHECSHGNFSSIKWINEAMGISASFFSIYPGYFARRREHLAHHKYQGDPNLDPVYPRIQSSWTAFFPKLIMLIFSGKNSFPQEFLPRSLGQLWVDRISVGSSLLACAAISLLGYFPAVVFTLLIPRVVVFFLHAFYICYLPHAKRKGGFEPYRVVSVGPLAFLFTMGQSAHGVHHRWPTIPWYLYAKNVEFLHSQLASSQEKRK